MRHKCVTARRQCWSDFRSSAHVRLGRTAKTYSIQSILFPQAEKPKTGECCVCELYDYAVVLNQ